MYAIAYPEPIETVRSCEECGSSELAQTEMGFVVCRSCGLEQDVENFVEYAKSMLENTESESRYTIARKSLRIRDESGLKSVRVVKNHKKLVRLLRKWKYAGNPHYRTNHLYHFIRNADLVENIEEFYLIFDECRYLYLKLKKLGHLAPSSSNVLRIVLRNRHHKRYTEFGSRLTSSRYLKMLNIPLYAMSEKNLLSQSLRLRQMSVALINRFPNHAKYFTPLSVERALNKDFRVNGNCIRQVVKYINILRLILTNERNAQHKRSER